MDAIRQGHTTGHHVVAMPYPGRGHVNPMMNFCKVLASRRPDLLITFVVTEEWLGIIGSDAKPHNILLGTIPNVVPSEFVRAADMVGFIEAISTKMEDPFERLLDRLHSPPAAIIADTFLLWAVDVGNRRHIPVASLWTMSATAFSMFYHFDLLLRHGHYPADWSERGDERVNYIPGLSSTRLADFPKIMDGKHEQNLHRCLSATARLSNAQYLLFTSIYELESEVIDAIKAKLPSQVYSVGPLIPYPQLGENFPTACASGLDYLQWLDSQPRNSVLYISLGSFISVSRAQMDEIAGGLLDSGVGFLWVVRDRGTLRTQEGLGDNGKGLVVPWCDQLRVLCHSSVGGFWTHCGWNSCLEGIFAGLPLLALPLAMDQFPNSKLIVEDWKTGERVNGGVYAENVVGREKISELVRKLMDLENNEGKEMRRRASELRQICQQTIAKGGLQEVNLNAFIRDILKCHPH